MRSARSTNRWSLLFVGVAGLGAACQDAARSPEDDPAQYLATELRAARRPFVFREGRNGRTWEPGCQGNVATGGAGSGGRTGTGGASGGNPGTEGGSSGTGGTASGGNAGTGGGGGGGGSGTGGIGGDVDPGTGGSGTGGSGGADIGGTGGTADTGGTGGISNTGSGGAGTCPGGCDDENPCTVDRCGDSVCSHAPSEDGTACDDSIVCTQDSCQGGLCVGIPDGGCVCDQCLAASCTPATDGCDLIADPADKALCQNAYACFIADSHPGSTVPGSCTTAGDATKCWCGTNPTTCLTSAAAANGPCRDVVIAAARSTDPATIRLRFADPSFPLGRAVNLVGCRGAFCGVECSPPPPPPVDCANPTVPNGSPCNDARTCTSLDLCQDGVCAGMPVADGAACDDGNICTYHDSCQFGACTGNQVPGCACDTCTADFCDAATDGCGQLDDSTDRALCESSYACFASPTHPGSAIPGPCTTGGDPAKCWCGTNSQTCLTSNAPPTQANGPCLQEVIAAAKSPDADTIRRRFLDPGYPLGRAVTLARCRGLFCSTVCAVP